MVSSEFGFCDFCASSGTGDSRTPNFRHLLESKLSNHVCCTTIGVAVSPMPCCRMERSNKATVIIKQACICPA